MGARSCFEEAFWGSGALLWKPWGDFVALLMMSGSLSRGSLSRSMAVFFWPKGSVCELWGFFLELLESVFSTFLES